MQRVEHMTERSLTDIADAAIDARIAAWLRQGTPDPSVFTADRRRLLHRIDLNSAGPLLALRTAPDDLPDDLAQALRQRLIAREMWEEQHKRLLTQALDALTQAGLRPILMKGTALAYSHYPRPAARVRGDSDILIEEDGRDHAFEALERAGFARPLTAGGATLVAEALFEKQALSGGLHDFDLHWRLNSSPVLARLFSHAELLDRSAPLDSLGTSARRLGDVDALLYAAVHRRLHVDRPTTIHLNDVAYPVIDSLTWLMDIHLLFGSLDDGARRELVDQALARDIGDILADALRCARERLGADAPDDILDELEGAGQGPAARYIAASPVQAVSMNLAAMRGLGAKATYLRELFLPPTDYMRARFSRGRFDWLPVLHLRRILPGLGKHLRNRRTAL